jgi:hypothetical protein
MQCKHYWEEAGANRLMYHRKALGVIQPPDTAALQSGMTKLRAWWGDGQDMGKEVTPVQLTLAEHQAVKEYVMQMYNSHGPNAALGGQSAAARILS